jgi:hypothetical protein
MAIHNAPIIGLSTRANVIAYRSHADPKEAIQNQPTLSTKMRKKDIFHYFKKLSTCHQVACAVF